MKNIFSLVSVALLAGALCGGLTSCNNGDKVANVTTVAVAEGAALPVAFIQADSLYRNYQLQIDLTQELIQKKAQAEEQVNRQMASFQKEYESFMQKVQTNAFIGGEARAQSEQRRLQQKQAQIQQHAEALQQDLALLSSQYDVRVNDSIQAAIAAFNADGRFEVIFSSVPNTTVFFVSPKYDITGPVLEVLNARYKAGQK